MGMGMQGARLGYNFEAKGGPPSGTPRRGAPHPPPSRTYKNLVTWHKNHELRLQSTASELEPLLPAGGWAAPWEVTTPEHWEYLCEGGNHAVFRFAGPAAHALQGTVLRLRKEPTLPLPLPPPQQLQLLPSDAARFSELVCAPLLAGLGHPRVLLPAVCHAAQPPLPWLRALDARLHAAALRAPHRRGVGLRLSGPAQATVQLDGGHCAPGAQGAPPLRTLCIELKPKWGLQPRAPAEPCRFCLQQLAKAAAARAPAPPPLSHYCPLDLFSAAPRRVRRALAALCASPQNNFRVFEGGRLLFGAETLGGGGGALLPAALAAHAALPLAAEAVLEALAGALCSRACPLPALLRLQGLSAAAGEEEGARAALGRLAGAQGAGEGSQALAPLVAGLQALLEGQAQGSTGAGLRAGSGAGAAGADGSACSSDALALAAFLLSASAKDASLLVRLRFGVGEGGGAPQLAAAPCFFLIDLDAKPAGRVEKYALQAQELAGLWAQGGAAAFAAAGKACSAWEEGCSS